MQHYTANFDKIQCTQNLKREDQGKQIQFIQCHLLR